jgi:uncharacterized protein
MGINAGKSFRSLYSPFSYKCNTCNKCCHDKGIQVNPYEAMRLAECLDISTTVFRSNYLKGQFLRHKDNSSACIFLMESGCTVHKDRPLVCRLYPLGRIRLDNGDEFFPEFTPHPECKGEYGEKSTVEGFLHTQETAPYFFAENAYRELIKKMTEASMDTSGTTDIVADTQEMIDPEWILDPDLVINKYCTMKGIGLPSCVDDKMKMHLKALHAWVDGEWNPI